MANKKNDNLDDLISQLRRQLLRPSEPNIPTERMSEDELIEELKGMIPGEYTPPFAREQTQRARESIKELESRGIFEDQIQAALAGRAEAVERFPTGRTIGGIAGSFLGPAILGRLIPGPIDDAALMTIAAKKSLARRAVGEPLSAMIGAGTLGATGEALQIGLQQRRVPTVRELFGAGAEEAAFEGITRYGVMGAKWVFSPFIKKTMPEATELMAKYGEDALHLSPAEIDKRWTTRLAEAVSRGSWGTDQLWAEMNEKSIQGINHISNMVLERIADGAAMLPPERLGTLIAEGIDSPDSFILRWMDELFEPLYKQVDEMTKARYVNLVGDIRVPTGTVDEFGIPVTKTVKGVIGEAVVGTRVHTKGLKELAKKELMTDSRMMKGARPGLYLSRDGRQLMTRIMGLKDVITFEDMRKIRSELLAKSRQLARDLDQSKAIVKRASEAANEALFNPTYTENLDPAAKRLLENTNRLYREAQIGLKEVFPEKLAKRLANKPASVVKELFPAKNPEAIAQLRTSLLEPVKGFRNKSGQLLWDQLRYAWYADLLETATKEGGLSKITYYNALKRIGNDSLKEMFSPSELEGIHDVGKAFKIMTTAGAKGTPLFTKSLQIGGTLTAYQGIKEGDTLKIAAGGTLALGPLAFAKLALHPKGRKILIAGLNLKPGSTALVPTTSRIVRMLIQIQKDEDALGAKALKEDLERRRIVLRKQLQLKGPPKEIEYPVGFASGM